MNFDFEPIQKEIIYDYHGYPAATDYRVDFSVDDINFFGVMRDTTKTLHVYSKEFVQEVVRSYNVDADSIIPTIYFLFYDTAPQKKLHELKDGLINTYAKKLCENSSKAEEFKETTLPRPVTRDGRGRLTSDYTRDDWFTKILEEFFEARASFDNQDLAEELTDIITVCTSYLHALGYDAQARAELQRLVNQKNFNRGYFEE